MYFLLKLMKKKQQIDDHFQNIFCLNKYLLWEIHFIGDADDNAPVHYAAVRQ